MSRYNELLYRLESIARKYPYVRILKIGKLVYKKKVYNILKIVISKPSKRVKIRACMAFGTHGDEDMSIQSFIEFIKSITDPNYKNPFFSLYKKDIRGKILENFDITAYFFNPAGLDLNQRSNGKRKDLNRWFGKRNPPAEVKYVVNDLQNKNFDVFIDLHGEVASKTFMIYERKRMKNPIAEQIIKAEKKRKIRVLKASYSAGDKIINGIVKKPKCVHALDDYMFYKKKVPICLTIEYGGREEVVKEIKSVIIAVYAALAIVSKLNLENLFK